jgi:uncharacterized RDD family membrane protein YckC
MRCPKCQYISFDSGERCRNCGYDFSLSVDVESIELPIHDGTEPIGPLSELSLNHLAPSDDAGDEENEELNRRADRIAAAPAAAGPITSSFDLPLFKERTIQDDEPLVAPGAAPRAPLAVRRTSAATKPHPRGADPNPRLALETAEMPIVPERITPAPEAEIVERQADEALPGSPAAVFSRLGAALIDALILGSIDGTVLYFTLKICELTFAEIGALPLAPFSAFLLLMNGAYFSTFVAAGGQTIGKMATGIRVVRGNTDDEGGSDRVTLGHAIVRAAGYLVSALPAGLGFVPALFGDRRALHDRLADTRVVKA